MKGLAAVLGLRGVVGGSASAATPVVTAATKAASIPVSVMGRFVVPRPEDVKTGVSYGPSGTDFVGTFVSQ